MAIKTESDLTENGRSLWLKALSAVELRNHGYAISLIQAVLKETPEFLEGRKRLRKEEIAATKGKKSFLSGFSGASLKTSLVKKDPKAAMENAEKALESDPYSTSANNMLKDAAVAADMPEVAAFALEMISEGNPKDTKILHELGEFYYAHGEPDKAIDVYTRITDINPADLIAIKKGKDAAARASMASGGWETATDYRDLIKDKDEAKSLEQKNRVVKSDEMIDQQICELYERAEAEPTNIDVAKKIGNLFEQKGELENALWWLDKASELSKRTDSSLERKVSDTRMKVLDQSIKQYEDHIAALAEDDPSRKESEEALEQLRAQKAETLISEARARVERNPTDLLFRYELGEQLLAAGQHTEAIPELQKARQNPNVRIKAMNLLGQCYHGKGMLDFAVRTFEECAKELPTMDGLKKEILYKLGIVSAEMGDKEKSLECMKQIYDVDYGYRDVATRVESSYGD